MKKVLMIILIVACLAGVGVLGYVIFRSKNIVSVDIEGQMQSLYFVNETTSPKFDDAKLVVTYKNGNVKKLDITSKNVKIDNFSTSLKSHGTMKITYKSQTIEKDYDVIESGFYYLSSEIERRPTGNITNFSGNLKGANIMFYFAGDGILQYYRKGVSDSLFYMNDGRYDSDYNYKIVGDTLVVNFLKDNGDKDSYNIKASYSEEGELSLTSTSLIPGNTEGDFPSGERVKTFVSANKSYKTNVNVKELAQTNVMSSTIVDSNGVFTFTKNTTLSSYNLYIRVTFNSPILYAENSEEALLSSVYVRVTDKMVSGLELYYAHGEDTFEIYYDFSGSENSKTLKIKYRVVEPVNEDD